MQQQCVLDRLCLLMMGQRYLNLWHCQGQLINWSMSGTHGIHFWVWLNSWRSMMKWSWITPKLCLWILNRMESWLFSFSPLSSITEKCLINSLKVFITVEVKLQPSWLTALCKTFHWHINIIMLLTPKEMVKVVIQFLRWLFYIFYSWSLLQCRTSSDFKKHHM